jgi:hypothetical protein
MKCLKLSGPNGIKVARCLIGSVLTDGRILIGVTNRYFAVQYTKKGNRNETVNLVPEIILPLDTLVFDPFAAMREGVWAKGFAPTVAGGHDVRGFIESFESNEWGVAICKGSTQLRMVNENITLDIEAACRLDGVEVVEV